MDEVYESVMAEVGLGGDLGTHENKLIEREVLLDNAKYEQLREKIVELKRYFSSSFLTSLQQNATAKQRFPLLNLVRQLLKVKFYDLKPVRKADGYNKAGKKQYRRYYLVKKMETAQPLAPAAPPPKNLYFV